MNKMLKRIIEITVLIIILICFYFFTFQLSHDRLIIKESKAVISIGDLNSKKVKSYYQNYKKITQTDLGDLQKWVKYIKGLDLIYFNDFEIKNKEDKEVLIINLGWFYPIAKLKQTEYFDTLEKNYFSLKDIYQKKLKTEYDIDKKIYMTNYKGYYFISDDRKKLSDYLKLIEKKEMNKNISSKIKGNVLGEVVIDLKGIKQGLDSINVNIDYKNNGLSIDGYLYGNLKFSKYFNGIEKQDRKLEKYIGNDRIYITNNDFKSLAGFIKENINSEINSMLSLIKIFTGKDFEDYVDKIDGEIIYDYVKEQMILPIKEEKDFKDLIEVFVKKTGNKYLLSNGKTIEIKNNVIYYNGIMPEGNVISKGDEFLNISLNLGLYSLILKDIYINIAGTVEENKIKIGTIITNKKLFEIYNRMEGKND